MCCWRVWVFKVVCSPQQGFIYLIRKYNKISKTMEYYVHFKRTVFDFHMFYNVIYCCDSELNLLSHLMSHDPSEIIIKVLICCSVMIKCFWSLDINNVSCNYYFSPALCVNCETFYFLGFFDENRYNKI